MKLKILQIEIEGQESEVLGHVAGALGRIQGQEDILPVLVPRRIAKTSVKPVKRQSVALPPPGPILTGPAGGINWTKYIVRVAQAELGHCVLCRRRIVKGDTYHDGAIESRRAHSDCVKDQKAKEE